MQFLTVHYTYLVMRLKLMGTKINTYYVCWVQRVNVSHSFHLMSTYDWWGMHLKIYLTHLYKNIQWSLHFFCNCNSARMHQACLPFSAGLLLSLHTSDQLKLYVIWTACSTITWQMEEQVKCSEPKKNKGCRNCWINWRKRKTPHGWPLMSVPHKDLNIQKEL